MVKEIIVLTKSVKRNNYCIAGIDTKTGEWIRPVSKNIDIEGAVLRKDILYRDGKEIQIFDKVKIEIISHQPTIAQPENYLYDSNKCWEKTGEFDLNALAKLRGYDSSEFVFYNTGKEVSEEELSDGKSLLLLKVDNPIIFIDNYGKLKMNFSYRNKAYKYFPISDPLIKNEYMGGNLVGRYILKDSLVAVFSLTGKYEKNGIYYKMVAKIFSEV